MSSAAHVRLMASYNQWMNARLYAAAATLPAAALAADRGAFFGSILGTLNHLANGDLIWLGRFRASHPTHFPALAVCDGMKTPASLGELRCTDLATLADERSRLDAAIVAFAASVSDSDLEHVLHYANTKGVVSDKNFFSLLMHLFNHQTHHRGQVTTLLSQQGVDVGVTDLVAIIPNEAPTKVQP